ncbi:MAG: hypothetical protein PHF57_13900 [Methanoregula sp.]|jgi:hypothetical protein|nr:hypothetical protein [Methanoregula sp.]
MVISNRAPFTGSPFPVIVMPVIATIFFDWNSPSPLCRKCYDAAICRDRALALLIKRIDLFNFKPAQLRA